MTHWAFQYIGKQWTPDRDCFVWFCQIQKEQFGRDLPELEIDHKNLVRHATRIMSKDMKKGFGWKPTDTPKEGDAVFMSQRNRAHHIGTVLYLNNKMHILHALEGAGVICSEMLELKINGWQVKGYYTTDEN